jgi:hypothetical protein|tara:strand:- start:353 stop:580 length:228 start_codon:yes stop_codon:yes gene_type:complete
MDIWKYWSPEKYSSFLKGVPLSEKNMEKAKALGETVFRTSRKNIRIKFRGPRPTNTNHTLKEYAVAFDAYLWERD